MRELEFIQEILAELSPFLLERFENRAAMTISQKSGLADLVTEADIEAQRRIEAAIERAFPGDVLVGEESGRDRPPDDPNARCWVCDPIDGTHNVARGLVPGWAVSLAFVEGGAPRAAGVAAPGLGQTFLATSGGGATRNGTPIRVSTIGTLDEARIEMDFARPVDRVRSLAAGAHAMRWGAQLRCHGAAVVGLCTVACGAAEAYIHGGLYPWDYAASMLIIREAGGKVTRFDGSDVRVFDGQRGLVASNGAIHSEIMAGVGALVDNPTS